MECGPFIFCAPSMGDESHREGLLFSAAPCWGPDSCISRSKKSSVERRSLAQIFQVQTMETNLTIQASPGFQCRDGCKKV